MAALGADYPVIKEIPIGTQGEWSPPRVRQDGRGGGAADRYWGAQTRSGMVGLGGAAARVRVRDRALSRGPLRTGDRRRPVGRGLNAPKGFSKKVAAKIAKLTGKPKRVNLIKSDRISRIRRFCKMAILMSALRKDMLMTHKPTFALLSATFGFPWTLCSPRLLGSSPPENGRPPFFERRPPFEGILCREADCLQVPLVFDRLVERH